MKERSEGGRKEGKKRKEGRKGKKEKQRKIKE